jgi:hypothetical protein
MFCRRLSARQKCVIEADLSCDRGWRAILERISSGACTGGSGRSKLPARSRGTCKGTGPTPVCTVLAIVPLREIPG